MKSRLIDIENFQLIESIFGGWPSFHDAEIHSIILTRDCEQPRPQMDIAIHHWEMTSEVDAGGFYVLKNQSLSTLRFAGVTELVLADFNHQNVMCELDISELDENPGNTKFAVSIPTSFGCEASFKCQGIRVLSSDPYRKS